MNIVSNQSQDKCVHPCTDKTIPTLNPNPITCIPNDKKSRGVYTDFITKLLF